MRIISFSFSLLLIWTIQTNGQSPLVNNNILSNGSFESKAKIKNIAKYTGKNIDIEKDNWAADWTLNRAVMSPGKYRIIRDQKAPEGEAFLQVKTMKGSHIYTTGGATGIKYNWSIWVKALPSINGQKVKPKLILSCYKYGPKSDQDKRMRYKGVRRIRAIKLNTDGKWRKYQSSFILPKSGLIEKFSVMLDLQGNIAVDDVSFEESNVRKKASIKTLLYLPFDKDAKAIVAGGDKEVKIHGKVRFTTGRKGKAALFNDGSYLEYKAFNNFDQEEGTVSFWFKPLSGWNDGQAHCLFEVPVPPYNFLDSGFCISKGFSNKISPDLFYFLNSPPWKALSVKSEQIWQENKWTHLLFCWSKSQASMALYINGILVVDKKTKFKARPSSRKRKIIIGARQAGNTTKIPSNWNSKLGNKTRSLVQGGNFSANALIDELYIFDRSVNKIEAWKLYGGTGKPPKSQNKKLNPEVLTKLTYDLKTPCIPFAKPLPGKKLKVLFIIPTALARDVVELKQRMDIDCDVYLLSSFYRNPYYATKHAKRFFYGVTDKDMINLLKSKLDKNPDIIAVIDAEWRFMLGEIRKKITSMVKSGKTSLLMTSRGINKSMLAKKDKKASKIISRGIPWNGLPEMFIHSDVPRNKIPEESLITAYYGKGRVAAIRFDSTPIKRESYLRPDAGLTPCLYKIGYTPVWKHRYGRYFSLTAKTILWLGKKKIPWQLELPEDGISLPADSLVKFPFYCNTIGTGKAILDIKVRDKMNHLEFSKKIKLDGSSKNVFNIPELKTGLYYIDVIISADNKVLEWGSSSFNVTSPEEIKNIVLDKDFYSIGDTISGKIKFKNSLRNSKELIINLSDCNKRIYQKIYMKAKAGKDAIAFSAKIDDPLTTANFVEVELRENNKTCSILAVPFFVNIKQDITNINSDVFPSIIWGSNNVTIASTMIYAEQLKKAGFNSMLVWPKDKKFHNLSMWGFIPAGYMTHLRMTASPDGGTAGGSWALPSVKEKKWQGIKSHLADCKKYSPLIYSLGDENIYRGEFGYSPEGLKFYRKFLKNKYGSIKKLNSTWLTDYSNFSEVPRLKISQAKKQANYPALIDHREAQEAVWREMFQYLRKKLKNYDSRAIVGAEGSETHDLEKMLDVMDFWSPYAQIRSDVFMRRSNKLKGHWYGSYCEYDIIPQTGLTNMWEQLFKGFSNASFYFAAGPSANGEGILKLDGSYTDFFKNTQLHDLKLIHNGIGQLLRKNAMTKPEVMMHWSRRSRIIGEIDQKYGTTNECDGRVISLLDRLNITNWGYITAKQLSSENIPSYVKVFILPLTLCISNKEAKTIERFVKRGGLLIGIGPVGIMNSSGKLLSKSMLSELFGVEPSAPYNITTLDNFSSRISLSKKQLILKGSNNSVLTNLKLKGAKLLAKSSNIPLVTENIYGNGTAYFINSNIGRLNKDGASKLLNTIIARSGYSSPVKFTPAPGPGRHWGMLDSNDTKLLGIVLDHKTWNKGTITLPEKKYVYNIMKGKYLGYIKQIKVKGLNDRKSAVLYALQSAPIRNVSVIIPQVIKQNQTIKISCKLEFSGKLSCKGRVVRIQFKSPDNKLMAHYQKMIYTDNEGTGSKTIEFALNDQPGNWTVIATDIITGLKKTAEFNLISNKEAK
jgi:Concanavalin A-like lectin/glucanases superfamily/Beta-galactosidase trimerisation domain/Beta-galactosidase